MSDFEADVLQMPPRNPARMPQAVEDFAADVTVNPLWDVAKGVGATASGAWNSPEAGTGLESAIGMIGPGLGKAAAVGSKFAPAIFAGVGAKTADRVALARAQKMLTEGADETAIWKETGWFMGADGKWRFEIPDNKSSMVEGVGGHTVEGKLDHPDLYKAYPDIGSIDVQYNKPPRSGSYSTMSGRPEAISLPHTASWIGFEHDSTHSRDVMLHEIQHAVQEREGFAKGTNPEFVRNKILSDPELSKKIPRSELENIAHEGYRRHAGEVEARNVSDRAFMDTKNVPPWTSEDVPRNKQTISGVVDKLKAAGKVTPVDHNPFVAQSIKGMKDAGKLKPVDHDPFAPAKPDATPKTVSAGASLSEIDSQLEKALEGSGVKPMDMIGTWGQKNAPPAAKALWDQKQKLITHSEQQDKKIDSALKKHGLSLMEVLLNPARAEGLPAQITTMLAERQRLIGK